MRHVLALTVALALPLLSACGKANTEPCGASNCSGCCDASGKCQGGNDALNCGFSGGACLSCLPGQQCQVGLCFTVSGQGGGTGGASGGGSGGGGGATGGGTGGASGGGTGGGGTSCSRGCQTPTPVCDPATNTCVGCAMNSDCPGSQPICLPSTKRCVACTSNTHCGGGTPFCDTGTNTCAVCTSQGGCTAGDVCDTSVAGGRCVDCLGNSDCSGATPVCDTSSRQCVTCTTGQGCGGATPVCDVAVTGGRCVTCTANSHCGGGTPFCDTGTNACVACRNGGDCGGSTPVCDASTRTCVRCTATQGCSGATPACDTTVAGGQCVGCLGNGNCSGTTPACDLSTRTCVRCTATSGCGGTTPVCDTTVTGGQCVGCTASTQCTGSTSVCDTTSRTCVTCTASQGCGGATPICNTGVPGGVCIGCTSTAQCSGSTPVCNTATNLCVTCTAAAGCMGSTPVCDTSVTGGRCVECTSSFDCFFSGEVCNTSAGQCVTCTATEGCSGSTPLCDTSVAGGVCVGCLNNGNCSGSTPLCNTTTRRCVACLGNGNCGGATPICSAGACVQCTGNGNCGGSTPVCNTSTNTCVGCTSNANCASPTPVCHTTAGACVQCTSPSNCSNPTPACSAANTCTACGTTLDCGAGTSCAAPNCVANPETCAAAQALTVPGTMLNFQADLRRAVDDVNGSCSGSTSPELVYRLPLAQARDVTISVAKASGQPTSDHALVVWRGTCGTGTELACADETFGNGVETVTLYNQAPGDLYFLVEAWDDAYNVLSDVSVVLSGPTPPPANDTCSAPQALSFTNGVATASGSFVLATNGNASGDPSPSCSSSARSTGRDLVYRYTLTQAQDVELAVTSSGTPSFTPVVYARRLADCAVTSANAELGCAAGASGGAATTRLVNQAAGDYVVFVDSTAAVDASFSLTVTLLPPTPAPSNDTCGTAATLTFAGGVASASGQTAGAANDYSTLSCSGAAGALGRDVVYALTVPAAGPLSLVAASLTSGFSPVLSVSATCPSAVDLSCMAGESGSVVGALLPTADAGVHYALLDGLTATGGLYRLDGRLGAPPNDTCASARVLAPSTMSVDNSVLDHTRLSTNDVTSGCSVTTGFAGKDLVYTFTPTSSGTVTLTVWADPNFDPVLAVFTGACGALTCLDTEDTGARGDTEVMTLSVTGGTTYTVVVDGYGYTGNPSEGFFRLELR